MLSIAGVMLAALGAVAISLFTFVGVEIQRVQFSTEQYEDEALQVEGLLIKPDDLGEKKVPGVVFGHGLFATSELYLEQCRELARKGFVVLAIDFRGHGATGSANDAGLTERRDIWAAADYLRSRDEVDPRKIAAAGHSLGAIASTTAGIFQDEESIKAVVAIAGQADRKRAAELLFGPIDSFLGKLWPFTAWSRQFDISSSSDLADRDVVGYVTPDRPPNYLIIDGKKDTALPVERAREIIEKAVGLETIEPDRTYGSFQDGTARRLEVTGDTHLSEAYSTQVWTALYKWISGSFEMEASGTLNVRAMWRYAGQALVLIGYFLVSLGCLYFARRYLDIEVAGGIKPYTPGGRVAGLSVAGVSLALFFVASIACLPFAKLTGLRAFVPFLGADVYCSIALSRTILLIPAIAIVAVFIRLMGFSSVRPHRPVGGWTSSIGRSLLVGVIPFAAFFVMYVPTAQGLYITRGLPVSTAGFITVVLVVTFQLFVEQEYFHYFFLCAFRPRDSWARRASYVLVESAVRGVAFGLVFIPLLPALGYSIGRPDMTRVTVLPATMVIGFILFLPASAISMAARRRGYSVLASSIALALLLATVFGCFLAVSGM